MKKKFWVKYGMTFFFSSLFLHAQENSVVLKASYFYGTTSLFRKIYSGAELYSIEANIQTQKDRYYGQVLDSYLHREILLEKVTKPHYMLSPLILVLNMHFSKILFNPI